MDISVVIPLFNEAESLPELYAWIVKVMNDNHYTYEIIFISDGSTDNSWDIIEELQKKGKPDSTSMRKLALVIMVVSRMIIV
ncbi:hypothetical protein FACS189415_7660 [Bacteroidia bacterium]|nr:hypothetical protein FACS189415_7660 [Bacteroidia bacterium]